MHIPPLKAGQTVGIVVPARKANEEQLRSGCSIISSWGLNVEFGKHCFDKGNSYLGASDHDRLEDFQFMLDNPSIDAIFCARGGYGTTRIIDQLDFTKFINHPKWIIGFSDITALHLKIHQLGIVSIHGCMPIQFSKPQYAESVESIRNILFEDNTVLIRSNRNDYNRIGSAQGIAIGGNLSLVIDSLGTSTEPDTTDKILILEEIDERLYKLDRMFVQLKRAGKLSRLAGLVIGHMTDISDTELPFDQSVEDLIMDKISEFTFPVAFNFPTGHEAPNLAWKHGALGEFNVTANEAKLKFLD